MDESGLRRSVSRCSEFGDLKALLALIFMGELSLSLALPMPSCASASELSGDCGNLDILGDAGVGPDFFSGTFCLFTFSLSIACELWFSFLRCN